jgi:hypothetical protein
MLILRACSNSYASVRTRLVFLGILAMVLPLAGCGDSGPKRVAIEGMVLVDGKPLPQGSIQFLPVGQQGPMAAATVNNGKFVLPRSEGPVAGEHAIEVIAIRDLGFSLDDDAAYAEAVRKGRKPLSPVETLTTNYQDGASRMVSLDSDRRDLRFELQTLKGRRSR